MAATRQSSGRLRRGSLERPVSARTYRGTWLLVALPLLLAAFSVYRPTPLPRPALPPSFEAETARSLAYDISRSYPNRFPGTAGATQAASWFSAQLRPYGIDVESDRFEADIPGLGQTRLENLVAVVPGASPETIVVAAHRDDLGLGPGANDNASGTAALVELARAYANPSPIPTTSCGPRRVCPAHTIVFLSTDGGAFGGIGAKRFAEFSPHGRNVVAVLNLDSIDGRGRPRLELIGNTSRAAAPSLVATAAARTLEESSRRPDRQSALRQLLELGFPLSLSDHAPFLSRGIAALTLTTTPGRPREPFVDVPRDLRAARIGQVGRAAQGVLVGLDQGLDVARGTASYVYLGSRIVRGWTLELVLITALLPFLAAVVDLFARCRRREIPLAPAVRSYRSRLGFWIFAAFAFGGLSLLGAWPEGERGPIAPETDAAGNWPTLSLAVLGLLVAPAWLVSRDRLVPRRRIAVAEEVAGMTIGLLALAVVSLLVVATNPYALVFVLPSLHAWLWLPHVRDRPPWLRAAVFAAGLLGPLLLLWSLDARTGLGLSTPWYLAELAAVGYVHVPAVAIVVVWCAAAAQLAAATTGRYAPYPDARERSRRGPVRSLARHALLAWRLRRRTHDVEREAMHG